MGFVTQAVLNGMQFVRNDALLNRCFRFRYAKSMKTSGKSALQLSNEGVFLPRPGRNRASLLNLSNEAHFLPAIVANLRRKDGGAQGGMQTADRERRNAGIRQDGTQAAARTADRIRPAVQTAAACGTSTAPVATCRRGRSRPDGSSCSGSGSPSTSCRSGRRRTGRSGFRALCRKAARTSSRATGAS